MKNSSKILFTEEALPFILRAFNKSIGENGTIIDNETGEIVFSPEGEELTLSELGAIKKGSQLFLKDDILSIMNIVDNKY